jgi:hypothetical protein
MIFQHAQTVAATAHDCHPNTHTPDQARAILQAVLDCIDLVGGVTQAARPRASAPEKPALANRTRATPTQPAPMNPVSHHYGAGRSERPPGDTDSGYWRNEYQRVHTHHDRCEVVRRAGAYLHGLVRRDPNAPQGDWTEDDLETDVLTEGHGWPLDVVARRFNTLTITTIATWRINDNRHPLTGKSWTPPDHKVFQAQAAREMRDAGLTSATIATSLGCSSSAVRMWTTRQRRAA